MREFESRRKVKKLINSPIALLFLVAVLFLTARATWDIFTKYRLTLSEARLSEDKLKRLEKRQTALISSTNRLSTDIGIEAEIRDRLQMAKVGESEIVIVEDSSNSSENTGNQKSFLQKIIEFFKIR